MMVSWTEIADLSAIHLYAHNTLQIVSLDQLFSVCNHTTNYQSYFLQNPNKMISTYLSRDKYSYSIIVCPWPRCVNNMVSVITKLSRSLPELWIQSHIGSLGYNVNEADFHNYQLSTG